MRSLTLILLLALLTSCGKPQQQLFVFLYPDYIDASVVADFEKEFNCKVVIDVFEDPGAMEAKLAAGGASTYDVVVSSHMQLPSLIQRGSIARLRHENIPNLKNLDPQFVNPSFDPGNQFSAPYLWGTSGIYLRKPKDRPLEETWGLLFDPAKQLGSFHLLEDIRLCPGAALHYKGYRINSTNLKELAEARDLLVETKRRSLGFATSFAGKNRVLAKDAVATIAYSNDAARGLAEDSDTAYFIPKEGGGLWLDNLSIPAKAPHPDLAEKFINHVLEAKAAARIATFTRTATPNKSALEFIPSEDRRNPAIYPPPEVMARLEYGYDLGANNKLYEELWTQIKAR